jgi:hypothetical protein
MAKSKTPKRESFPSWNISQTPGIARYSTLPTPTDLRNIDLFGLPLTSAWGGAALSDAAIQSYLDASISELEHELDLYIMPVQFSERHDFVQDFHNWNFNYIKLNHPNVIEVTKVEIKLSNDDTATNLPRIAFPLEFVHILPQEAALQLVPSYGTTISGFIMSMITGASFYTLFSLNLSNIPGALMVEYTAGFEENKVPAAISSLIRMIAAAKILSSLGPVFSPINSQSVSIDGTGQSASTPGTQIFAGRIADLDKQIAAAKEAIKSQYQRRILIDYI